jgi:FMN phosphatase YigB (HAD superfamily)
LDNTLWNTSATIDRANDILAQYIGEKIHNITSMDIVPNKPPISRVEKVMGKLFASDKAKYAPIEGKDAKAPVLLTKLRKDAIQFVLNEYLSNHDDNNTMDDTTIQCIIDTSFEVWMYSRHEAISQHMTPYTTDLMGQILSLKCHFHDRVIIGAITDGNSNPKLVPELSNIFDFYVNAEMVGVGKPDKRIYIQAVKEIFHKYPTAFTDLIPTKLDSMTDDQFELLIGPWWVHIGDDFVKDIVASNNLKMRNIWMKELINPKKGKVTETGENKQSQPRYSLNELIQVVNENKVVEMSIGADTYLADAIRNEFATAAVDQLRDVIKILQQWQNDAFSSTNNRSTTYESRMQQDIREASKEEKVALLNEQNVDTKGDFKFCIACGTKLPIVAKFCSSCGQGQTTLLL